MTVNRNSSKTLLQSAADFDSAPDSHASDSHASGSHVSGSHASGGDATRVDEIGANSLHGARADLEERRAMIGLSMIEGVGPRRLHRLIAHFGSACAAMSASPNQIAVISGIGKHCATKISSYQLDHDVDRQIRAADRVGAFMISESDERYPDLLREIYLPPPFLWVRGEIPSRPFLAVVGTRRPTDYGRHIARKIATELVVAGVAIVSGLAYGIDQVAHQAALDAGGATVAVLGSGIDNVYPTLHIPLARRIERSGAIVSEFPLGTKPDGPNFPQRNRIISGMCAGTVVIEAYEKGGALITALFANEQNREVFAVPGRATTPSAAGTNQLIRDGAAKLVMSAEDVLSELRLNVAETTVGDAERHAQTLDPTSRKIIAVLGSDVKQIEDLFERTGLPMGELLSALMMMEVNGVIRQYPGKSFGVT